MNEVSIIINGVRYDAVKDNTSLDNNKCAFFSKEHQCRRCIIGMEACMQLIGVDGIFVKSTKKIEL